MKGGQLFLVWYSSSHTITDVRSPAQPNPISEKHSLRDEQKKILPCLPRSELHLALLAYQNRFPSAGWNPQSRHAFKHIS